MMQSPMFGTINLVIFGKSEKDYKMDRKKILSICICFCIVTACGVTSEDLIEEKEIDRIGTPIEEMTYEDSTCEEILEELSSVSYYEKNEPESVTQPDTIYETVENVEESVTVMSTEQVDQTVENVSESGGKVEIIDSDNYILRCVLEGKEHIVEFKGYENTFIPYTMLPEIADVTGDGKEDLIVNVRIDGNNLCETLSDTYVYIESKDGLEEILYIEFGKMNLWDERYKYNLGCSLSEGGELIFEACNPRSDSGVIEECGIVILKYVEGEWKKQ